MRAKEMARGAHGARLERDIEVAIDQPLAAEPGASRANGEKLGVRRRVAQARACGCRRWPAPRLRRSPRPRRSAPRREQPRLHGPPARQGPWAARPCLLALHLQASHPCAAKWAVRRDERQGPRKPKANDRPQAAKADRPSESPGKPPIPSREPMRIAKAIAHAGLCSRRDAERMIEAGRVAVNGKVLTTPAHVVAATDKIVVDGKPLPQAEAPRLWRYHKPRGLVTSHKDPQGRKTVFEALPGEPAARRLGRTARHQHRGAVAAHHRRRARPPSRAAEHRLAQALPRARAWARHPGGARCAARGRDHRRHPLRAASRRASTASKAPISGSRSRFAKARTAR